MALATQLETDISEKTRRARGIGPRHSLWSGKPVALCLL
jgi:hypothetical protein